MRNFLLSGFVLTASFGTAKAECHVPPECENCAIDAWREPATRAMNSRLKSAPIMTQTLRIAVTRVQIISYSGLTTLKMVKMCV